MEKNKRVVKSFLEENLNQYFAGQRGLSRGNVVETAVQCRDSEIVRHNKDNKYGRSVPSSEYNKHERTPLKKCEQIPLYYRRDDIQFGSSAERYGKRNNDSPFGGRNIFAVGDSYGSKGNDDRSANSSHCESKSSSKNYGYSGNDNNLRNSDCYSNDSNSRNRDSCIGCYDKSQVRNSDALAADRFSNYNVVDNNNVGHYDINCDPRNDDEPPRNYVRNNIDRFNSNNISNDSAANTNRFSNNAVANIGSNTKDCFERNNHPTRNDFSNEFMNNVCFKSDHRSGNNRFNVSRNNDHPESNSYSGNNYFGTNKQMYTNVSEMTTPTFTKLDRKRPYEYQTIGAYNNSARIVHRISSFNSSTNNVSAMLKSTSVNVTPPGGKNRNTKKKDVRQSTRRINASIRSKNEKYMNAAVEVQKVKRGNSKADPEKYWKAWWPKYAYIEKSIQTFDDEDMKFLDPFIRFIYKPSDSVFLDRKRILLRQGVNKINRNINITESNYKARDLVKMFMYRKQLSDPNFHQYLQEGELRNVTNALNWFKGKVILALFLQNMIYKWHDFTEILDRRKNGEDIPGRHAENSMNDKLFHYLVSDCIKELKQICSGEWSGFDEFYNSLTTTTTQESEPLPDNRPGDQTSSSEAVVLPGTTVPVRKHTRPSKKKYNDRRLSLRILQSFDKADPATLDYKQSQSLKWARTIAENQDTPSTSTQQSGKRLALSDKPQDSKRAPVISGNADPMSFADGAKDSLVLAVINRGDEDGNIPKDKWSVIENELSCAYSEVLRELPGPPPDCDDAGWYQGRIKLMRFGNERSVECYRCALRKIGEIWPGAALDVVKREDIPSRPRAHAWIPATPSDAVSIIKRLQDCNPGLPTHNWKVSRLDEADGARMHAVFILNAESLSHIVKSEGRLSYGFDRIQLMVYKSDSGDDSEDTPPDNPGEVSVEGSDESLEDELLVDTDEEANTMVVAKPDYGLAVSADKHPPL